MAACSNHVGVRWSLIGVKCLIWTVLFLSGDTKSEEMETWMPKLKPISFEPELNQRPKIANISSTVLRSTNWAIEGLEYIKTTRNLESLTSWVFEGNQAAFCGKCIRPLPGSTTFRLRPRGATGSASDSRSEGCVFKSRRGQVISYWREVSNMNGLFYLAIRSPKKMKRECQS